MLDRGEKEIKRTLIGATLATNLPIALDKLMPFGGGTKAGVIDKKHMTPSPESHISKLTKPISIHSLSIADHYAQS